VSSVATVYDFTVGTADGASESLKRYEGEVLLIVNVASKCGLTPQYEGLEALYREQRAKGLEILGFPCNQFGGQEPGSMAEILEFCSVSYDVTFPIFAKVDVNGDDADPLFTFLRAQAPGDFGPNSGPLYDHIKNSRPEAIGTDEVKWNFTKFLVDRDGAVLRRYEPTVLPAQIQGDLAELLA
jgi:glutathione peroxidase